MPQDSVVFDRAADFYDETRGFPPGEEKAIGKLIAEAGGLTPSSRVLEIGVGTGRIALPVSAYVKQYIGADLSRPMMDRLRAKRTVEPIQLVLSDATRLPIADNAFDAAVVVHVFHLIPGYLEVVKELERVLKPDARLIVGRNQRASRSDVFKPMIDVWEGVIPSEKQKHVGVQEDEEDTFLATLGWQPIEPRRQYPFTIRVSPRQYFESHQRRIWSSNWRLNDEEHAHAVEEVRRVMEATYPDPDQLFEIETGFNVDVYLPPN